MAAAGMGTATIDFGAWPGSNEASAVIVGVAGIQFDFEAPLVINPGEFVQIVAKILVGTATATEVFQWIVSPNLYHE